MKYTWISITRSNIHVLILFKEKVNVSITTQSKKTTVVCQHQKLNNIIKQTAKINIKLLDQKTVAKDDSGELFIKHLKTPKGSRGSRFQHRK